MKTLTDKEFSDANSVADLNSNQNRTATATN